MPVKVVKGTTNTCKWKIVEIETNRVVGCAKTKKDAEASARIRNKVWAEKQRRQRR